MPTTNQASAAAVELDRARARPKSRRRACASRRSLRGSTMRRTLRAATSDRHHVIDLSAERILDPGRERPDARRFRSRRTSRAHRSRIMTLRLGTRSVRKSADAFSAPGCPGAGNRRRHEVDRRRSIVFTRADRGDVSGLDRGDAVDAGATDPTTKRPPASVTARSAVPAGTSFRREDHDLRAFEEARRHRRARPPRRGGGEGRSAAGEALRQAQRRRTMTLEEGVVVGGTDRSHIAPRRGPSHGPVSRSRVQARILSTALRIV